MDELQKQFNAIKAESAERLPREYELYKKYQKLEPYTKELKEIVV